MNSSEKLASALLLKQSGAFIRKLQRAGQLLSGSKHRMLQGKADDAGRTMQELLEGLKSYHGIGGSEVSRADPLNYIKHLSGRSDELGDIANRFQALTGRASREGQGVARTQLGAGVGLSGLLGGTLTALNPFKEEEQ